MRNLILAISLVLASATANAATCPALEIEGQRMSDAEETGQAQMEDLLTRLGQAKKWGPSELASYAVEVNSRGRLPELQRLRQVNALKAASLAFNPKAQCEETASAFRLAADTIKEQWDTVNAEINRDLIAVKAGQ